MSAPDATELHLPSITALVSIALREMHEARVEGKLMDEGEALLDALGEALPDYSLPHATLLCELLARRVRRLEVHLQDEREQRRSDLKKLHQTVRAELSGVRHD